jgi:hypothetical protein
MHTACSADLFGFTPVEGRKVVAAFDGGQMTSDAGAMQAVNRVGGWDFDPRFINEICEGLVPVCSAAASYARPTLSPLCGKRCGNSERPQYGRQPIPASADVLRGQPKCR